MPPKYELEQESHAAKAEANLSTSTPKADDAIVNATLEAEAKKLTVLSQRTIDTIIDEPLKAEVIIAIEQQNFRGGVYKNIVKNMKSPISALGEVLWCRKLEAEERKAMQDYYNEAISIYKDFENGEKDVSEFISQETWDILMEVFFADAKKRQTGIAARSVLLYDDEQWITGTATIYRDDTYDFVREGDPGDEIREKDDAKWLAAVKLLDEKLKQKGLKKRIKNQTRGSAEYRTVLRLEFDFEDQPVLGGGRPKMIEGYTFGESLQKHEVPFPNFGQQNAGRPELER